MTRQEIENLDDKDVRDWLVRLSKQNKFKEIMVICKIRLNKK